MSNQIPIKTVVYVLAHNFNNQAVPFSSDAYRTTFWNGVADINCISLDKIEPQYLIDAFLIARDILRESEPELSDTLTEDIKKAGLADTRPEKPETEEQYDIEKSREHMLNREKFLDKWAVDHTEQFGEHITVGTLDT